MGLFNNQFANVIEWNESRDDVIFWLWRNKEIKRGSRLVIRPGQDAIFLYNGKTSKKCNSKWENNELYGANLFISY